MFVGRKRPAEGWLAAIFIATFILLRARESVAERSFPVRLPAL
ncbi:hypothetical protein [Methylobacterium oxalidis]